MSQPFDETQHPRDAGGQFATKVASESHVELGSDTDRFADVPDPLPGQTLVDGRPAEASFAASYAEYFRPLHEWEAEHGRQFDDRDWPDPKEAMAALGFAEDDLGRFRGAHLGPDDDSENSQYRLVVHTRNGGGNRECHQDEPYADGCDCTGCTMTKRIPELNGYLYDRDDEGDRTYANIYFELPDDLASRKALSEIDYNRMLIEDGKAPTWSILSPRPDWSPAWHSVPHSLTRELQYAREKVAKVNNVIGDASRPASRPEHRTRTVTTGRSGRKLRRPREVPVHMAFPDTEYQVAVDMHARYSAELKAVQTEVAELDGADVSGQPPAVRALVEEAAARKTAELERRRRSLDDIVWKRDTALWILHDQREDWTRQMARAEAEVARVHEENHRAHERDQWTRSWPGNPDDAPPHSE